MVRRVGPRRDPRVVGHRRPAPQRVVGERHGAAAAALRHRADLTVRAVGVVHGDPTRVGRAGRAAHLVEGRRAGAAQGVPSLDDLSEGAVLHAPDLAARVGDQDRLSVVVVPELHRGTECIGRRGEPAEPVVGVGLRRRPGALLSRITLCEHAAGSVVGPAPPVAQLVDGRSSPTMSVVLERRRHTLGGRHVQHPTARGVGGGRHAAARIGHLGGSARSVVLGHGPSTLGVDDAVCRIAASYS